MLATHEVPLALMKKNSSNETLEEKINGKLFYALVHLFDETEYYEYVIEALKKGRQVILDNSAYELHGKPFDTEDFVERINSLAESTSYEIVDKQLTYIIPDVFDEATKTRALTQYFLDHYYDSTPGKAMAVCQGNTFEELTYLFAWYSLQPEITKIGVNFMSKAYTHFCSSLYVNEDKTKNINDWAKRMIGRRAFIEHLYHLGWLGLKPIHLLGAALPGEFIYYTEEHPILASYIETLDTSAPIICGMFGEYFDVSKALTEVKRPEKLAEHLKDPLSSNQIDGIIKNVEAFRAYNKINFSRLY